MSATSEPQSPPTVLAAGALAGLGAVVTGAGSGIGRAIALRLAALGADVVGIGRREEALRETAALAARGSVEYLVGDIRSPDRIEEIFAELSGSQRVDVVVNNAGGQFVAPAAEISERGWRSVVDLNLNSVFSMCRAAYPLLSRNGGSIVNISLSGVERGMMGIAHSVAARAGVLGLSRTLALEWAPDHIRVNCIGPGTVMTEALSKYGDTYVTDRLQLAAPLGRTTSAEEVAELTAFLASPAGALITGQLLHVDGGAHLGPGLHMI